MSTAQWKSLVREDEGQDLIEYTLLLSFIVFWWPVCGRPGASVAGITNLSNPKFPPPTRWFPKTLCRHSSPRPKLTSSNSAALTFLRLNSNRHKVFLANACKENGAFPALLQCRARGGRT